MRTQVQTQTLCGSLTGMDRISRLTKLTIHRAVTKCTPFIPRLKIRGKLKLFKELQECSTLAFESFPSVAAQPMNEARGTA